MSFTTSLVNSNMVDSNLNMLQIFANKCLCGQIFQFIFGILKAVKLLHCVVKYSLCNSQNVCKLDIKFYSTH